MVALGVCGCSHDVTQPASGSHAPIAEIDAIGPTLPTPTDPGPPPAPEALSDVVVRLADPAVPGTDKLPLVENTTAADAAALDTFAAALRDSGFTPVTVRATDIVPGRPGDVVATITVTGPESGAGADGFTFPMEFRRVGNGWQLTQQTAEMLLAFGSARTDAPRPPAPSPSPPR